jgi:hypothetical protein
MAAGSIASLTHSFCIDLGEILKVFISWSGNSRGVAQAINKALPSLFDKASPWISTDNRSGSIWLPAIDAQLTDTDFGIVCVSKANQHAPWLNFEAGALSRRVDAKRELMPVLLIDFDSMNEVEGPVTGFQMQMATVDGFFAIMKDLNSCELGPNISEKILRSRVELAWLDIEKEVRKVRESQSSTQVVERTDSEKIDEVLDVVRGLSRAGSTRNWSTGTTEVRLDSEEKRLVAKAIGDAGKLNELGEIVTSYPDDRRVLVSVEKPISADAAHALQQAATSVLWRDIEVSFQPMSAQEVANAQALNEHIRRFGQE